VLLLVCIVGARRGDEILRDRRLIWMGRISYSLYLSHVVVLLTLMYTLRDTVSPHIAIWAVPLIAIPVAAILFRVLEQPAMAIGRAIENRAVRFASRSCDVPVTKW
jgi:peptidoglycan/LPS O-acetylase OafA/YrhL